MLRSSLAKRRKISAPEGTPTQSSETDPSSLPPSGPQPSPNLEPSSRDGAYLPSAPRYLPPHLHNEIQEDFDRRRSPTPEIPSASSSPSAAYAGLSLNGDKDWEMSELDIKSNKRASPEEYEDEESGLMVREPVAEGDEQTEPEQSMKGSLSKIAKSAIEHGEDIDIRMHSSPPRESTPTVMINGAPPDPVETLEHADIIMAESTDAASSDGTSNTPNEASSRTSEQTIDSRPSIDEQIGTVLRLSQEELKDGQTGYLVSAKWLERVLSRSAEHPTSVKSEYSKEAREGEIGPVDNSDLNLMADPLVPPLKDERGDDFVHLKPGLKMGEDFEVLPQEAWDSIITWYGLAKGSPVVKRYAHNTTPLGGEPNIQYELRPVLFSILKLPDPNNTNYAEQFMKSRVPPPVNMLASRQEPFMKWLKRAKELAGIDIKTKVRVWRILGGLGQSNRSGMLTPAASRSASPAPGVEITASAGDKLVLDVNEFTSLAVGSQRDLVEAKDETANCNYNGHSSLDHYGLSAEDVVIVLEEQIGGAAGGEWASDTSGRSKGKHVPISVTKNGATAVQGMQKSKSATNISRSNSPATIGMTTRGRARRDGRPKGITGLNNLGNTCYMNSALQCVRSVEELSQYFLADTYKQELNPSNPLSHNGEVAKAYAGLLHSMYGDSISSSLAPRQFKNTIGRYGPSFSGYGQQDSQEFLLFLLDGLQEDLNRIQKKPYIEKPDSTDEMVHNLAALREMADKCWDIYKARNDSVVTDLFAGMYKSTLVCPVCDKVSIIFDPFNNLTLQLPIENVWSRNLVFIPYLKEPVQITVDMDKHATIFALKEYVAAKVNSDAKRMILAEVYKHKFFKVFDNRDTLTEAGMQPNDEITLYELECVPSNYPAPKRRVKKYPYNGYSNGYDEEDDIPDGDSPLSDRMAVPVFHRYDDRPSSTRQSWRLGCLPTFIIITREEAKDYDRILQKVLGAVGPLTSTDIFEEGSQDSSEGHLLTEEDGNSSVDSKVKAASVEGEDGFVDVTMNGSNENENSVDNAQTPEDTRRLPKALRPGNFISTNLQTMFDMKYLATKEVIPSGWSSLTDENKSYPTIASRRVQQSKSRRLKPKSKATLRQVSDGSSMSSDAELDDPPPLTDDHNTQVDADDSDADELSDASYDSKPASKKIGKSKRQSKRNVITYSRKGKKISLSRQDPKDAGPLIRLCEGIILDWRPEIYSSLFGGTKKDGADELRGAPTWEYAPELPDPTLQMKRELRKKRRQQGLSLGECLDEFGRSEILSENDAWYCPRCKEHRRASKTFELWTSPDILVIHLKRFSSHRNFRDKLDVLVDFPVEGLDLTGRVAQPEDGKSLIYDLCAVDNHYGGLGGGHYTAFAKNFIDGNWYEYNDSMVSKKNDPHYVVSNAAYLLFYRRRSEKPLGGPFLEQVVNMVHDGHAAEQEAGPASTQDSQTDSSAGAGEGRRLGDDYSHSSSAGYGVGASHRLGVQSGGLAVVNQAHSDNEDDGPPEYSAEPRIGEAIPIEGMDVDEGIVEDVNYSYSGPYNLPSWSFNRLDGSSDRDISTVAPPTSAYGDDEDLFKDDGSISSNKVAVSSSGLSDVEGRLADFADDEGTLPGAGFDDPDPEMLHSLVDDDVKEVPPLVTTGDDEEDSVAEVRVDGGEEDLIKDD
ncbi:MAG: CSN-associated deubiquitinating enzyme Ubp12 [Cirrosporium novae-zelandiae]|nr:MAG: CSN-associated deubiquitinating enzyme Ubp12 [Cirrosporium novae-zelandiae]